MTPEFEAALSAFVEATQARLRLDLHARAPVLTVQRGSKNVKIVRNEAGYRSVFCFVRIADGAVLKAAGWAQPAKGVRGSIYVNAGQDAVTVYGAIYFR
jgi:hypothetical protein